jgi:hypothetical protein
LLTSPYALSLQLLSFISFSLHFFFFGGWAWYRAALRDCSDGMAGR